ncbi:hypothetical protein RQP46_006745 [Phenoliferia psychrophenolica]
MSRARVPKGLTSGAPRGQPSAPFFPSHPPASAPRTTKPPSSLWYTARPSLNETLTSLDQSLLASRGFLFRAGLLPSISAPINHDGEFHAVLPHPRHRRWKQPREMASYLKTGADLRNAQYKRLTAVLSGLEGLLPYAQLADSLPPTAPTPALELDPVQRATTHQREKDDSASAGETLQSQLEQLLARFQQPQAFSASGVAIDRVVGQDRRLGKKDPQGRVVAVGRRKESGARVWIVPVPSTPASAASEAEMIPGRVLVNTLPIPDYFHLPAHRAAAIQPLRLTSSLGSFNLFAIAKGGGLAAQADAVAMATARALVEWERCEVEAGRLPEGTDEWRVLLKRAKLLERDPRMVERKKTGQPKARKKNTWVKR